MANQPMDLGTLLAFIKQPPAQAAPAANLGQLMQTIQRQPSGYGKMLFQKAMQEGEAKRMAGAADEVYGTPGGGVTQLPYQMDEAERFEDEAPIEGLMTQKVDLPTGIYDETVAPEQRYNEMAHRMSKSGISGYQQQAMNNLQAMQNSVMSNTGAMDREMHKSQNSLSTAGKMAREAGLIPGTKEYQEFIVNYAMKSNYESSLNKPFSTAELTKWMTPDGKPITYGTPAMAQRGDLVLRNEKPAETAGKLAMLDSAYADLDRLEDIALGPDSEKAIRDMFIKTVGSYLGVIGDAATNVVTSETGQLLTHYYEKGLQGITRLETGAAMPATEVDNTRLRFQPLPGEEDATKRRKVAAYRYFIENARNLLSPARDGSAEWSDSKSAALQNAIDESFMRTAPPSELPNTIIPGAKPIPIDQLP